MRIEIYGIPEAAMRCPGCLAVTSLLDKLSVEYSFYPVLVPGDAGFTYDRPLIVSLAKRAKFTGLNIRYPVMFVDDSHIRKFSELKSLLIASGYDQDIIED